MKYVRMLILLAVSAVAVATATSCSKNPTEEQLLGSWVGTIEGQNWTFNFTKGGNGNLTIGVSGVTAKGTIGWSLNETNIAVTIKTIDTVEGIKVDELLALTFAGTFDGKTLVLEGVTFTKK